MHRPSKNSLSEVIALATIAAAALAGGGGCRQAGLGGLLSSADTIYVGVAVGLQSPERYVNVFEGVRLALDELNAKRPRGAPALALRRAPAHATSPVEVAAAFRDDPLVVAVVGHTESAATISATPVYEDRAHDGRNALAAVTPTASAALVTRPGGWVFRVCPLAADQARALARHAADSLRLPAVAVLYRNDVSSKDMLRAFAEEYERRGGAVVERDPFLEEIPEFEAYARRLTRRGARAVVVFGNATEALAAIRAIHRVGGAPVFLSSNPPAAAPSDTAAARDFAGMRYAMLYAPDRPATAAGARFAQAFLRRTGHPADHWGALGYDAAMLIGRAVHEVGPDRRRVRAALAAVGRTAPAYEGATGVIRFDARGDPVEKPVLVRAAER